MSATAETAKCPVCGEQHEVTTFIGLAVVRCPTKPRDHLYLVTMQRPVRATGGGDR